MKDAIYEMRKLNLAPVTPKTAADTVADKAAENNLLTNPTFNTFSGWVETICNHDIVIMHRDLLREDDSGYGKKVLCLWSIGPWRTDSGVYQKIPSLSAGEYVLSANVRVEENFYGMDACGVFLRISDAQGNTLSESKHVTKCSTEYAPLSVTVSLEEPGAAMACIYINGAGKVYVDNVKLEKAKTCDMQGQDSSTKKQDIE